jgi:hypothetical protein
VRAVVNLVVPEAVLIDRLAGRSGLEHRSDDRGDTVLERLKIYHEKTEPLIDFYRRRDLLTEVDGLGTVPEITERLGNGAPAGEARQRGRMITIRSLEELVKLEEASRVVLETLDAVERAVAPGRHDRRSRRDRGGRDRKRGARPAFVGYAGTPRPVHFDQRGGPCTASRGYGL